MAGPSVSDWEKHDSIIRANVHGFNALRELPKLFEAEFSWGPEFNLGFCAEDDIAEWRSKGWQHVQMEWLQDGRESLNRSLPLRFGITDDGSGLVRWRGFFLMAMPKTIRKAVIDARNAASEERFAGAAEQLKYVAAGDARGKSESQLESKTVQTAPADSPKRRGRPPKNKE